jgi:hypothetical protein
MVFQIYLSLLVCILFLSTLFSCFLDSTMPGRRPNISPNTPEAAVQQAASELSHRLLPDAIVEWQVDVGYGDLLYVYGKNAHGEEAFKVVFDRKTNDPVSIVFSPHDENSVKGIIARSPREMADFWLRRLSDSDDNPYRWIRDGRQGKQRYFSTWESPTRSISLTINTQTGYIVAIHFFTCAKPGDNDMRSEITRACFSATGAKHPTTKPQHPRPFPNTLKRFAPYGYSVQVPSNPHRRGPDSLGR